MCACVCVFVLGDEEVFNQGTKLCHSMCKGWSKLALWLSVKNIVQRSPVLNKRSLFKYVSPTVRLYVPVHITV